MTLVSEQDRRDAELVGREGVRALTFGATDHMVALRSLGQSSETASALIPLTQASGPGRHIPAEWLTGDASTVTSGFADYVRPIMGEPVLLPIHPLRRGSPFPA